MISFDKNVLQSIQNDLVNDKIEKVVVGAITLYQGKALLLTRVENDFMGGLTELPSGTVDPGESLLDALERELEEETKLNLSEVSEFIGHFDYKSGSGKRTRQLTFLVSVNNPLSISLNPSEHSEYYWLSSTDSLFDSLNISDETKSQLKRYV